jgi:phospholipase C
MLENRSFDHMLGYSGIEGINGIPDDRPYSNPDADGKPVFTSSDAHCVEVLRDPGHAFEDVYKQIYGRDLDGECDQGDKLGTQPPQDLMQGFVTSYSKFAIKPDHAPDIMRCYSPKCVPVLTGLASSFAVCSNWFSSIPGPTLPNRLFAHAGTSKGRLDMSAEAFDMVDNIYTVLDECNVPSTIYADSFTGTTTFPKLLDHQDQFFGTLDDFYQDCYDDNLPAYCFIEPRYGSGIVDGTFRPQNDQHPDSDINEGEHLIYSIYKAIRSNRNVWHSSILVVTYDEHGGLFDHVVPPKAIPPDDDRDPDHGFKFDRYGVRVPAVIVSAYTPHKVIDTVFDHTSLIATARKLFTAEYRDNKLGNRAMCAKTFDEAVLVSPQPSTDHIESFQVGDSCLEFAPCPVHRGEHDKKALDKELNHLQRDNLIQAISVNNRFAPHQRVKLSAALAACQTSEDFCKVVRVEDAEHFIHAVMTNVRHSHLRKPAEKPLPHKCEDEKPK